jgi:hypothetical protein
VFKEDKKVITMNYAFGFSAETIKLKQKEYGWENFLESGHLDDIETWQGLLCILDKRVVGI